MSASDTDPRLVALEAQVLAAPGDRALLSIYADTLAAAGDPRGELLALEHRRDELIAAGDHIAPAIADRITRLATELLGDAAGLPGVRLHRGFLEASFDASFESAASAQHGGGAVGERATRVLAAPIARYLRELRVRALPGTMHHALRALAARPRPYLTELHLGFATYGPGPALADDARTELAAFAPRLTHLVLDGEPPPNLVIPKALQHADLRSLATFAWFGRRGPHPVLRTLAITADPKSAADEDPTLTLRRERYPAVTTLDLSGYEPVDRSHATRLGLVQRILRMMLIGPQLRRVILPSLRDLTDAMLVSQQLAAVPLEELVVARSFVEDAPPPTHPTARLTLPARAPYPPLTSLVPSEHLRIEIPGSGFTGPCAIAPLVAVLDREYAALAPAAQAAWRMLFALVAALPPFHVDAERHRFPATVLAHALDSVALALPSLPQWQLLRGALGAHLSPRLTVMVSRYLQTPS